jgi:hypothetical protein
MGAGSVSGACVSVVAWAYAAVLPVPEADRVAAGILFGSGLFALRAAVRVCFPQ